MQITIDEDVIKHHNLSMLEFLVILYHLYGGTTSLDNRISKELWNKGYLVKDLDYYKANNSKIEEIEHIIALSAYPSQTEDLRELAIKLRELYPEGKKEGTNYYWRDSVSIITKRLAMFFKKYGNKYSENKIISATKDYVSSFNGNYRYMQLLKYFIYKRGSEAGEETSQLLSYIENMGQESRKDWTTKLV